MNKRREGLPRPDINSGRKGFLPAHEYAVCDIVSGFRVKARNDIKWGSGASIKIYKK
jgi:hypothetical protein